MKQQLLIGWRSNITYVFNLPDPECRVEVIVLHKALAYVSDISDSVLFAALVG